MSGIYQTHRRKILAAGALGGGYLLAPYLGIPLPNPMRTPAVAGIEHRYSVGGASNTHTPGVASARGNPDKVVPEHMDAHKGVGTKHFADKVQDQRQDPQNSGEKAWNQLHYGTDKNK